MLVCLIEHNAFLIHKTDSFTKKFPVTIVSLQSVFQSISIQKYLREISFDRKQFDIQHTRGKSCFDPEQERSFSRLRVSQIRVQPNS